MVSLIETNYIGANLYHFAVKTIIGTLTLIMKTKFSQSFAFEVDRYCPLGQY